MELLIIVISALYMTSAGLYFAYLFFQINYLSRLGLILIFCGFLCHTSVLVYTHVISGHFPVRSLHETLSVASWATAGVFLLFQYRFNLKILGIYAAPLVALVMVAASRIPHPAVAPNSLFKNFWVIAHVIALFTGEAAFALAAGIGILYLLQEHAIKTKNPGFFFRRLPSLDRLDHAGYACIIIGFTTMTLGLIAGFVYARGLWGRFWSWDPKEVWSAVTWLLYAALLHERLTVGWRGRRAAIMAIIGFAFLLFTFLGVNFLMKGHHGQFTRF